MKEHAMEGGKVNMCKGLRDWLAEEKATDIVELLQDVGTVSEEIQMRIKSECDMDILKKWLKLAARAETVEEFVSKMDKEN